MENVLQEIIEYKRDFVAMQKAKTPISELQLLAKSAKSPKGFITALQTKIAAGKPALIAELKKASPSKGLIRAEFEPNLIAKHYENGGATCLSVLTDEKYFAGCDAYLQQVAQLSPLPTLRKDFIIDEYQIVQARALGADCILLIMAALNDSQASELESCAHEHKLDVLIEVHDSNELDRALKNLKTPLIGINNRNLKTLSVDLQTSIELRSKITGEKIAVCESGIKTNADIKRMQAHDINCFLVGESLMMQPNIELATKTLLTGGE